jgi:hypothetical protein
MVLDTLINDDITKCSNNLYLSDRNAHNDKITKGDTQYPGGLQTNINNIYGHDLSTEVSCIDKIRIKNNK